MRDLQDLYLEFSHIVIEQGTVMDRIDSNLFEARDMAKKSKEQVQITYDRELSKRSKYCINCLV